MRALTRFVLVPVAGVTALVVRAEAAHELGDALKTEAGRHYSATYIECYDTTILGRDRLGCAVEEAQRQDRRMNLAYRQTIMKLSKTQAAELRLKQRRWIAQRDQQCRAPDLRFDDFDPSNDNGPNPWCVLDMTILRTLWLVRYSK